MSQPITPDDLDMPDWGQVHTPTQDRDEADVDPDLHPEPEQED